MPKSIPFCRVPGLPSADQKRASETKAERDAFYSGPRWRKLREAFLREFPLCASCERQGRLTLAVVVHHIVERLKRPDLAYEWKNLESACNPCHTAHHKSKG